MRGILQGNPAFSMSSSYSFAHHNSVYQLFFFFILFPLLSCFPLSTYFPTNIPSFFVSFLSSPFFPSRFLFLLTIIPSSSLSALPPPPSTPSHHPLLPLPPFYLTSFSNPFPSSYPLTHPPLSSLDPTFLLLLSFPSSLTLFPNYFHEALIVETTF